MDEGQAKSNKTTSGGDVEDILRLAAKVAATDPDLKGVPVIQELLVLGAAELWAMLQPLTARARRQLLSKHRSMIGALFNLLVHSYPDSPTSALALLDVILWRRRFVNAFEIAGRRLARADSDRAELVADFYEYRRHYAEWAWSNPMLRVGRDPGPLREVVPDSIQARPEYDDLWQRAFGDIAFADYAMLSPVVGSHQVVERIPHNAALVEYWRVDHLRSASSGRLTPHYFAVAVAGGDSASARAMVVSAANEVDAAVGRLLSGIDQGEWAADAALDLRGLLFDRLPAFAHEASHLYIVPDGSLSRIPFAALPMGNGFLLDRLCISYLQSGSDLARVVRPTPLSRSVVVAAPAFDISQRGELGLWRPLPKTAAEGAEVADMLGVTPALGRAATADVLYQAQSPKILHVATHGDFLPARLYSAALNPWDPGAEPDEVWLFESHLRRLAGRPISYPELRSVLVLAGANDWIDDVRINDRFGRGHLTSEDLAGLNLEGTELVVLSACSSGVGGNSPERGVLGFRSALNMAGARTLVMSLWQVEDRITKDLMVRFYQGIKKQHLRSTALHEAQLTARRLYQHPLLWGAFIMEGQDDVLDLS